MAQYALSPPCNKIPFVMAVIANSLTPKCIFLPEKSSFEIYPSPFITVLFEGERSAEPPIRLGNISFNLLIMLPEIFLVAAGASSHAQNSSLSIKEALISE